MGDSIFLLWFVGFMAMPLWIVSGVDGTVLKERFIFWRVWALALLWPFALAFLIKKGNKKVLLLELCLMPMTEVQALEAENQKLQDSIRETQEAIRAFQERATKLQELEAQNSKLLELAQDVLTERVYVEGRSYMHDAGILKEPQPAIVSDVVGVTFL